MHIASFKNMGSHAPIATCYHTSQLATCYRTSQVMLCFLPINLILNSQFWFTVCMYSSLIFCSLISALHQATRDSTSKQGLHYCCSTMGPKAAEMSCSPHCYFRIFLDIHGHPKLKEFFKSYDAFLK